MKIVNGLVFENEGFVKKDICIENDRIVSETNDIEFTDAEGLYIIPGSWISISTGLWVVISVTEMKHHCKTFWTMRQSTVFWRRVLRP